MARKPKTMHKPAKVDARVPDRIAYAADIAARKAGMSRSSWIGRVLQRGLIEEGFDSATIDRLWSRSPAERLFALANEMPDLLSEEDRAFIDIVMKVRRFWSPGDAAPEFMSFRGGALNVDEVNFFFDFIMRIARGEGTAPNWDAVFAEHDASIPDSPPATEEDFLD